MTEQQESDAGAVEDPTVIKDENVDENVGQGKTTTTEDPAEEMVPLSALQGVRADLKSVRQSNQLLAEQLEMYRKSVPKEAPKGPLSHLTDSDVITVGEVKQLVQGMMGNVNGTITEMQMQTKYPDYGTVIKVLPDLATKIPGLRDTIASHSNPYMFAYTLAKEFTDSKGKVQIPPANPEKIADKVKKNLEKPVNPGSSSAASVTEVNRIAAMSSEEFQAHVEKVKSGRN